MVIVKLTAAGVIAAGLLLAPQDAALKKGDRGAPAIAQGLTAKIPDGGPALELDFPSLETEALKFAYVPGAIIFDFGGRENAVHPDRELGVAMAAGDLAWDAVLAAEQHADPDPEKK